MAVWTSCAKGVRYREHPTRKHNKRPDRYYVLSYKPDGKTVNEAVGWASDGHTQGEAEDLMGILRKNWRSGAGPQSLREMRSAERDKAKAAREQEEAKALQEITLAEYWTAHYLPTGQGKKVDSSWRKELEHYKNWIAPLLGDLPIIKIETRHWDALVKAVRDANRSQRSVEYIAGTLRHILRHARARKHAVSIPLAKAIGATAPLDNERLRVLTPTDKEQLIAALREHDSGTWRPVFFAMLTGCRLLEALGLKWGAIDLDAGVVRFIKTKNKGNRTIPLAKPLLEMFAVLREELGGQSDAEPPADAFVFLNERGKPWTAVPGAFLAVVEQLELNKGREKLDRVSFHTMRHTTATELAKVLDIRTLMAFMGWKNIAMAARYIHPDEETQRAALATLERRLKPTHDEEIAIKQATSEE